MEIHPMRLGLAVGFGCGVLALGDSAGTAATRRHC
jgi:hypothetical protein